jgi:hypothetical protein
MKLHPIAEKVIPVIAAILLMLSHSNNVMEHAQSLGLKDIVSIWK